MRVQLVGLMACVFLLFGCNKEELARLKDENTKLKAENTKLKAEFKVFQDAEKNKLNAKEDARQRALAYYRTMSEVVALQVEGDEAVSRLCAFFTCDSIATKADVKRIVRIQHGYGLRGWRVTMIQAPKSRVELLADDKVKVLVENERSIACLARGKAGEISEGAKSCKKAHKKPWRKKCEHASFTFARVGEAWKRSGIASVNGVACP